MPVFTMKYSMKLDFVRVMLSGVSLVKTMIILISLCLALHVLYDKLLT